MREEKKSYEPLEIEIIEFENEDIITDYAINGPFIPAKNP